MLAHPATATPAATPAHLAPPPAGHCLNCHHRLAGPFCHHCGQSASVPPRITAHHLLHELPHTIWHVDHGIVYTVREMLLRPGLSIKRFLAGERKPFFHPLSLLILVGGVSAFLFGVFHIVPYDTHQPGLTPRMQEVQQQVLHIIQRFQAWLSILFLPVSATIATPLLRRRTGYTWAEQLVAAALMSGAVATAGLLFIPAMAFWSGQAAVTKVALAMTLAMLAYKTFGYAQLQALTAGPERPFGRWGRGLLVAVLEYVVTIVVFGGLPFVVVLLTR